MNDFGLMGALSFAIAIVMLVAAPAVVIAVNVTSMKRRSTNKRCALAILLVAATWLVALVSGAAVQSLGTHSVLRLIPVVICLSLTLTSFVLAIIGLLECGRHHRYHHGRKRALIALALDLLIFAAAGYALFSGIYRQSFRAIGWRSPTVEQRVLPT